MYKHPASVENEGGLSFFQTVVYLLLGTLSLALLIQQALFFIGLSLSYMVFIASFFAVSAYLYHQKKASLNRLSHAWLFTGIFYLASVKLAILIPDSSYDGNTYHFPAVYALADGWNPIYEFKSCSSKKFTMECGSFFQFIDYYPKAFWMLGAFQYQIWGNVESAKVLYSLFSLLTLVISYQALRRVLTLSNLLSITLATAIALNPVVLVQYFSFYIDGLVAQVLSILILSAIGYLKTDDRYFLHIIFLLLPYLVASKFQVLAYSGVLFLAFMAYSLVEKRSLRAFRVLAICAVAGVFYWGFNPYVTNAVEYNNPFYPVIGSGRNIANEQANPDFIQENRFYKAAYSIFSNEYNGLDYPTLKWPLSNLHFRPATDHRFSGMGPWFSGLFLLSVFCCFFIKDRLFFFVIFGIWTSIIINPASWWARYVPQLWTFVPLTFAYFAGQSNRGNWLSKRHMDYISLFFLVVLTVNISVVGGMSSASAIWFSLVEKRDRQLFCSGHDSDWNWYAERMSEKYGSLFTATLKRKLHDFGITTEKGECY